MIIDFQQHYTPPELLKGDRNAVSVQLDQNGNPTAVGHSEVESVREQWLVEDRWWTAEPLRRHYFELAMRSGAVLVVFRELTSQRWYAQKGA